MEGIYTYLEVQNVFNEIHTLFFISNLTQFRAQLLRAMSKFEGSIIHNIYYYNKYTLSSMNLQYMSDTP